jgi:hypothetical protein
MFRILWAAFAALVLASCGGGGDAGADAAGSASPSGVLLKAKKVSPIPDLVAEPVSVVNTPTTQGTLRTIGATSDGGYVVAWFSGSSSIYIQAYDSTGAKAGAPTKINLEIAAGTPDDSRRAIQAASVVVLNDGSVVVVYRVAREVLVFGSVEVDTGVYFQRFDANGNQLIGETQITLLEESPANPRAPFISGFLARALSDGGFVVAWTTASIFTPGFPNGSSLTLRWFDSQGQPQGSEVQVGAFSGLEFTSMQADSHGGVTLAASFLDQFFHTHYAVWHYDANHVLQPTAPGLSPMSLLPLESGYVLFTGGSAGATAQILDAQGNPIGTPSAIPAVPIAARELADGTYVAIWPAGGGFVAQRFAANGTRLGEPLAIDSNGAVPSVVALADTGFAAAWSTSRTVDSDMLTQRFVERFSDRKKACLNSARGLKGQQRKAFVDACMG